MRRDMQTTGPDLALKHKEWQTQTKWLGSGSRLRQWSSAKLPMAPLGMEGLEGLDSLLHWTRPRPRPQWKEPRSLGSSPVWPGPLAHCSSAAREMHQWGTTEQVQKATEGCWKSPPSNLLACPAPAHPLQSNPSTFDPWRHLLLLGFHGRVHPLSRHLLYSIPQLVSLHLISLPSSHLTSLICPYFHARLAALGSSSSSKLKPDIACRLCVDFDASATRISLRSSRSDLSMRLRLSRSTLDATL